MGWETLLNRPGTTFRKLPDSDNEGLNERDGTNGMAVKTVGGISRGRQDDNFDRIIIPCLNSTLAR
jgi:hypothetical protein